MTSNAGAMTRAHSIRLYLDALQRGDAQAVLALFNARAVVHSPVYGSVRARQFYPNLFADTACSRIDLNGVFENVAGDSSAIALFRYDWTLSSGAQVSFLCCDVFRFSPRTRRIAELTIIYDTAVVRKEVSPHGISARQQR